jgi:hypothetical protein
MQLMIPLTGLILMGFKQGQYQDQLDPQTRVRPWGVITAPEGGNRRQLDGGGILTEELTSSLLPDQTSSLLSAELSYLGELRA